MVKNSLKEIHLGSGALSHMPLISALRKQRQANLCEFKASWGYRDPALKKKKKGTFQGAAH